VMADASTAVRAEGRRLRRVEGTIGWRACRSCKRGLIGLAARQDP
jgi:hypothetical protein